MSIVYNATPFATPFGGVTLICSKDVATPLQNPHQRAENSTSAPVDMFDSSVPGVVRVHVRKGEGELCLHAWRCSRTITNAMQKMGLIGGAASVFFVVVVYLAHKRNKWGAFQRTVPT
jgi:hypothetical protein